MDHPNAEMNIGTSEKVILIISFVGFLLIGSSIYILLSKTKSTPPSPSTNQGGGGENGIEDDNAGGNRAQRRARARRRRDEQQQQQPAADDRNNLQEDEVQEEPRPRPAAGEEDGGDENADGDIPMSRKERLKATKRAEKEERRRMEEHRREELRQRKDAEEAAYQERKQKEREEEEQIKEKEAKEKQRIELEEKREYEKFKNLFVLQGSCNDDTTEHQVEEEWGDFIQYIQQNKFVRLDVLGTRFQLTRTEVLFRLNKLEQLGKLMGITNQRGEFIHITRKEMDAVADFIKRKGRVTNKELANEIANFIQV